MAGKRLKLLVAYIIIVAIGIPVWWKTTEVYRAPLPFDDLHEYAAGKKWELFEKLYQQYPLNTHGRAVKAATGYRLSFTLANADPSYVIPSWDFPTLEYCMYNDFIPPANSLVYLNDILNQLSVIADFTVDSQVFHYASLLKPPLHDKAHSTYYIPENSISQYINPDEWKLDFSTDTRPLINFIVYIPSQKHSPLKIQTATNGIGWLDSPSNLSLDYAASNAYIIPQWGGVKIYNPKQLTNSSSNNRTHIVLSSEELAETFSIFVAQLKELLSGEYASTLSSEEYDLVVKRRLSENIQTSSSTLLSLAKLIDSLPNMVVLDNIHTLVQTAIDSLNAAHSSLQRGDHFQALQASREALRASELAFFDPNMLSLLYFPDEHKYSVYTPILLPVVFSILGGIVQEYRHYKNKRLRNQQATNTNNNNNNDNNNDDDNNDNDDNDTNHTESSDNQSHIKED